ncbi:hypothetical protein ACKLNR_012620 [Fusarium oxysporum f. sp. zingiberi]
MAELIPKCNRGHGPITNTSKYRTGIYFGTKCGSNIGICSDIVCETVYNFEPKRSAQMTGSSGNPMLSETYQIQ